MQLERQYIYESPVYNLFLSHIFVTGRGWGGGILMASNTPRAIVVSNRGVWWRKSASSMFCFCLPCSVALGVVDQNLRSLQKYPNLYLSCVCRFDCPKINRLPRSKMWWFIFKDFWSDLKSRVLHDGNMNCVIMIGQICSQGWRISNFNYIIHKFVVIEVIIES